jgi:hypothetical protein
MMAGSTAGKEGNGNFSCSYADESPCNDPPAVVPGPDCDDDAACSARLVALALCSAAATEDGRVGDRGWPRNGLRRGQTESSDLPIDRHPFASFGLPFVAETVENDVGMSLGDRLDPLPTIKPIPAAGINK